MLYDIDALVFVDDIVGWLLIIAGVLIAICGMLAGGMKTKT